MSRIKKEVEKVKRRVIKNFKETFEWNFSFRNPIGIFPPAKPEIKGFIFNVPEFSSEKTSGSTTAVEIVCYMNREFPHLKHRVDLL